MNRAYLRLRAVKSSNVISASNPPNPGITMVGLGVGAGVESMS